MLVTARPGELCGSGMYLTQRDLAADLLLVTAGHLGEDMMWARGTAGHTKCEDLVLMHTHTCLHTYTHTCRLLHMLGCLMT